ncbi:MAG: Crp/Fnr family transcriptional regulator [Draconibacterium sp.]|nr:MAG: Crp/Fnr family transcriptional regulator [Draconibacterium sp.]PIF05045.1 MAG: Crp/Fnr family transcriptional regulator [Draconibacterium sp.]
MDLNQHFPEELEILQENRATVTYLKGENIFKQGAFAPYVLYVNSGLVKVYLQTGYEKQINLSLARQGDFLSFASVFGENIHTYSAQAIKETVVCMVKKESLKEALLKHPDFALRITSKNYRNESHLFEIVKNLSYKQMRGKLASGLLYLSQEDFMDEDVFSYLSRQDIADFASISTESAIKFLKEFEKEKIIKLKGKTIRIINRELLKTIGKNG